MGIWRTRLPLSQAFVTALNGNAIISNELWEMGVEMGTLRRVIKKILRAVLLLRVC